MGNEVHPLRAFRERQSPPLTKAQLAELLGVSPGLVTRLESGERQIGPRLLPTIAERTGLSVAELRPDLAELMRPQEAAE